MSKYIALFVFISLATISCQNFQNPTFVRMENVRFNSINLGEGLGVSLVGDVVLNNPNDVSLDISGLELDAYVDGNKMGEIVQEVSAKMEASSDFNLPVKADIPLKQLFKNEDKKFNLNFLKKKDILIRLEGIIKINAMGVIIDVPMEYEEPYELSLGSLLGG